MSGVWINFQPPGPVAMAFLNDRSPVGAIMGPIGSAKTSTCLMKCVAVAQQQGRSPVDGVRYTKFGVIRDTYRNLDSTTIPSWHQWMPPTLGQWKGSQPAEHRIRFNPGDGIIDMIMEFIALGDNRIEDVMRGWEGTGAYLNEFDRLDRDVMTFVRGRVGRYPSKLHGGASWYGVWGDLNAPDTDNWVYEDFVEKRLEGFKLFRQPSGLSAQAENARNLPAGYYDGQMKGQPDWYIRRMIRNEFGFSRDGKPVFEEFNDALHVAAADLEPAPGIPLIIGADAGGTPAAVIKQRMPNGQWRALDELIGGSDGFMGPTRFGEMLNMLLRERYRDWKPGEIKGYVDPSAIYGADKEAGEKSWVDIMRHVTGIPFLPAASNELRLRLEAVRVPMTRMIDGQHPGYLMSPRMRALRRAYNSGYRYRRVQIAGGSYADKPDKNPSSHVADADQYAQLGGGEHLEVLGRRRPDGPRQTRAIDEAHPRGEYEGGQRDERGRQAYAID